MRDCVDRFGVAEHLRFNHAVEEARWDDAAARWVVQAAGEEYRGRGAGVGDGPAQRTFHPGLSRPGGTSEARCSTRRTGSMATT